MARVDLVRRAQIGLRLRAKSRAQLIRAARALFAIRPVDAITVDDVTREAELAKGTFYVHFQHLDDLRAPWRMSWRANWTTFSSLIGPRLPTRSSG